jgi:hypothetical protein
LLSIVDINAIVTIDKSTGIVYIGGKRAEENRLANLKSEAMMLLQSDLWKNSLRNSERTCATQMFISSESIDDMKKGKSMLYTLSTQKNIIDVFNSYQPKPKQVDQFKDYKKRTVAKK